MTELEQALFRLGGDIAFPEAPDVAASVARRVAEPGRRGFRLRERRALAVAVAVVVLAVGAALAVPPARTAILDFFGLRGASVQRVETIPKVPSSSAIALELGRPVPVVGGRPRVKFPSLLLPRDLGSPDAAYYSAAVAGGKISLVYKPGDGVPRSPYTGVGILITEFRGDLEPDFIAKFADPSTSIERLSVDGHTAIWLEDGPHAVIFRTGDGAFQEDAIRLAGNTLLVQHGMVLVRIEGALGRERALAIAESLEAG
jgi:hypothetical protein